MRLFFVAMLCAGGLAAECLAAGFVHSENFVVLTPRESTKEASQRLAHQILDRAELLRSQIAREWCGAELTAGDGRAVITISFSPSRKSGLTWQKDHPDRRFHNVFLQTSRENALGGVLRHEIAHVVLATKFPYPHGLPVWLEEGVASRYDDRDAIVKRRRRLAELIAAGQPPRLGALLDNDNLHAYDTAGYSAAESVVDYLLTLGDKGTLLEFGREGVSSGWEIALQRRYRVAGVAQFEADWLRWLRTRPRGVR